MKVNGYTIKPKANLQGAKLHYANIGGANLWDANLQGANLEGAYLWGADLWGAILEGANLEGANLQGADITDADLEGANLRRASLNCANLQGANLKGADLQGADLRGTNLNCANLEEAKGCEDIPKASVPGLARKVLTQIKIHPETWDQREWHSDCGTKHCVAGWAVILAGDIGAAAEKRLGTRSAAELLLGGADHPFGPDDDPIPWLIEMTGNG